jgi:hypothetical protein
MKLKFKIKIKEATVGSANLFQLQVISISWASPFKSSSLCQQPQVYYCTFQMIQSSQIAVGQDIQLLYCLCPTVSEHMGWVRNVALMNVYFGSGKPQGVGISGRGARWADEGNAGVSLWATQGRGGRILSQQGGFQVSGKGNLGSKGTTVYITYLSYVYNGMNAAVNDTSCLFA